MRAGPALPRRPAAVLRAGYSRERRPGARPRREPRRHLDGDGARQRWPRPVSLEADLRRGPPAVEDPRGGLRRGRPDGASPFAAGRGPWNLAVADLNHDGKTDVVTANGDDGSISILLAR